MVQGTVRVAEACLEHGVERLVYVSSTAALYLGATPGRCSDDVPPTRAAERALYARGKTEAEQALLALHASAACRSTSCARPSWSAPARRCSTPGSGLWVRDNHCVGWGARRRPVPLVQVDDVADALARLAGFEGATLDGRALNLAAKTSLGAAEVHLSQKHGSHLGEQRSSQRSL